MLKLAIGCFVLLSLAACSSARVSPKGEGDLHDESVCYEQSRLAKLGKVDGHDISITCADGYKAQ
jgi:hypothetical protein